MRARTAIFALMEINVFGIFKKKVVQQSGAEMAEEGLMQIASAVKNGSISLEQGRVFKDIYVHADRPNGTPRISYVITSPSDRTNVIGRCVVLVDRAIGNTPVWQIDWAVDKRERGKGLGRKIVEKSLAEFTSGMKGKFKDGYFIEAVVDSGNIPSNRIAELFIGGRKEVKDPSSGMTSNSYLKRFEG